MNFYFETCVLLAVFTFSSATFKLSTNYTQIYGPGLSPNIILPARYFFIKAFSVDGKSYATSPGNTFDVKIRGYRVASNVLCRIQVNMLDRKDGSFIVRYKLYEVCRNLEIAVLYNGNHVADSPYYNEGLVFSEECSCMSLDVPTALKQFGCSKQYVQIDEDLKTFPRINFTELYPAFKLQFGNSRSTSVCNYILLNNKIYRKCYGEHTDFKMFIDAILLSLTRKVRLKDMEFFVNIGDWPLVKKSSKLYLPIFSWCGSEDTVDIVMPTYDLTESTLQNMGRVSVDMLSVQGNIDKTWDEKTPKAFWRGRDSSRERLKLINISRKHPNLINASLTNFFFFRDVADQYGPKEPYESFFKFFNYKYQINLDGTVAAYRFPYLLVGDSLVLKQESPYYEHFYKDIKPWKHYIPIKRDLSDIVEQIKWAIKNDNEARKIAITGQEWAQSNLLPQNVFCYHMSLFDKYSHLLQSDIVIRNGMESVHQSSSIDCHCDKINNFKQTDEL